MPEIHPASSWQNLMIQTCGHSECSDVFHDRMLIRFALRITPSVDLRRLNRAFEKLIQRHDSLRLRFAEIDGEWKAVINDRHPSGLQVREFGDVDDQSFEKTVNEIAAEPISVFADALCEMLVLNFGKRGDVLVVRVHHAITDGYGIIVMIEEFLKYSVGLPIIKPAMSHREYVNTWDNDVSDNESDNIIYWEEKILPVIPPIDFGRRRRGVKPLDDNNRIERTIGYPVPVHQKSLTKLAKRAGSRGVTLHNYIMAAFADVICDLSGSAEVYIAVPVARHDHRLDTFVGEHSKLLIVRYKRDDQWTMDQKAMLVAEEIREGIIHLPTTAFNPDGKIGRAFSEAGILPLNYMAHVTDAFARANRSPFSGGFFAGENSVQRFGRWSLERLQLRPQAHTIGELQINLYGSKGGYSLELGADGDAFTADDLVAFGRALMIKFELD